MSEFPKGSRTKAQPYTVLDSWCRSPLVLNQVHGRLKKGKVGSRGGDLCCTCAHREGVSLCEMECGRVCTRVCVCALVPVCICRWEGAPAGPIRIAGLTFSFKHLPEIK